MSAALINWIIFTSLVALWGTSFLFTAIAVRSIPPVDIVAYRIFLGTLTLSLALLFSGRSFPRNPKVWVGFLIMGALGNVIPFFLIAWGQQSINSGMAGVIMAIMPLVTVVLAHFFIADEYINRYKLAGFVIGISGVVLLLGPVIQGNKAELFGALSVLLAAICYASNTVIARKLPSYGSLVTGTAVLLISNFLTLPFWIYNLSQEPVSIPELSSILSVIWLGIGPTGFAALLYYKLIERAGPTFLSNINYLIPAVAFFSGALVLNEPIKIASILALVTILCGIAMSRVRA